MNKKILKISIGIAALGLALCAAFFSVTGLAKLFIGAGMSVVIMASTLEITKLVLASYLYQFWDTANKALRAYYVLAVFILAVITSMGIYGFLSNAYQGSKSKFNLTQTELASYDVRKEQFNTKIQNLQAQVKQKSDQINQLTNVRSAQAQVKVSDRNLRMLDRSSSRLDNRTEQLTKDIDALNQQINIYSDSAANLGIYSSKKKITDEAASDLGALFYISKVLNVDMDKLVNFLILLFVLVFDPLAITLVIAFNSMTLNEILTKKEEIPNELEEIAVIEDDLLIEPNETPNEPENSLKETGQISSEDLKEYIEPENELTRENGALIGVNDPQIITDTPTTIEIIEESKEIPNDSPKEDKELYTEIDSLKQAAAERLAEKRKEKAKSGYKNFPGV